MDKHLFEFIAERTARIAGSKYAFGFAIGIILGWASVGPYFYYSDTWQLFINTGTTIVTFLMVFLIQNSQNREMKAMHTKFDEMIRATPEAKNELMGLEKKAEVEIEKVAEEIVQEVKK